jgi:hypothetical protein
MGNTLADIGFNIYKGLEAGKKPNEIVPEVKNLAGTLVADVNRSVTKQIVEADDFAKEYVIAVSPNGCPFCKSLTLDWGTEEEASFHSHCNCVIDASFKEEIKFRQEFQEQYFKDVEAAKELIASGDAGVRTVQAGTDEWATLAKKDLASKAREFRKNFEEDNEVPKDERAAFRNIMDERVNNMMDRANLVAQGKATFTEQDIKQLQRWGVDSEELLKPRTKKINSLTQKNVNLALEIVQGNRQVRQ